MRGRGAKLSFHLIVPKILFDLDSLGLFPRPGTAMAAAIYEYSLVAGLSPIPKWISP